MQKAGADVFTFHVEAMTARAKSVQDMIDQVKAADMKVGIALKPNTPVEEVTPFLAALDLVRLCFVSRAASLPLPNFLKQLTSRRWL